MLTLRNEIGGGPAHRTRLQSALVISQVALSLVSLVCAGLFIRSLEASRTADVGFTGADRVLLVSTDLHLAGVPDSQRVAVAARLLERLRAVPGVEGASLASMSPLGFGGASSVTVYPEGYEAQPNENTSIEFFQVGSDYFPAMGIPVVRGRGIGVGDVAGALDVAVVNERFAQRFWPGQDPIGRRFRRNGVWRTVVGVAKQGKYHYVTERAESMVYVPFAQESQDGFDVIVRAAGDPKALTGAVHQAFRDVNADLPFLDVRTMAEHMEAAMFVQTLGATMLSAFGLIALLLSAIGIFGVLSYHVGQRTREIGVRVALGASGREVVGMVVGRALRLVGTRPGRRPRARPGRRAAAALAVGRRRPPRSAHLPRHRAAAGPGGTRRGLAPGAARRAGGSDGGPALRMTAGRAPPVVAVSIPSRPITG